MLSLKNKYTIFVKAQCAVKFIYAIVHPSWIILDIKNTILFKVVK